MEVRMGTVPLNDILSELDDLVTRLEERHPVNQIPPPDLVVEKWLVSAYQRYWADTGAQGTSNARTRVQP